MPTVKCSQLDCKYNSNRYTCKQKKIYLTWNCVATVNDGQQEFLRCKQYEQDPFFKELDELFKKGRFNVDNH